MLWRSCYNAACSPVSSKFCAPLIFHPFVPCCRPWMPQWLSMERRGVWLCVLWPLNLKIPRLYSVLLIHSSQRHLPVPFLRSLLVKAHKLFTYPNWRGLFNRFREHDRNIFTNKRWVSHTVEPGLMISANRKWNRNIGPFKQNLLWNSNYCRIFWLKFCFKEKRGTFIWGKHLWGSC